MKTVLFVDDDIDFLNLMSKAFQLWTETEVRIESATTVGAALVKLESMPVDLIVSDLNMPIIDGAQFMRLLNRKYPRVHKVMLTGFLGDPGLTSCSASGAELILEKPRHPAELDTIFFAIREILEAENVVHGKGGHQQADLNQLLEMFCNGGATLILEISSTTEKGYLYVEKGFVTHAETQGGKIGMEAFCALMTLPDGNFKITAYEPPPSVSIRANWDYLQLELARTSKRLQENEFKQEEEAEP